MLLPLLVFTSTLATLASGPSDRARALLAVSFNANHPMYKKTTKQTFQTLHNQTGDDHCRQNCDASRVCFA